ncbi:hypothetical protein BG005_001535 [Podila minutissima]|nr:hypothetical protein BG005_001535 [Podila minutissima]
MATTIKAMSTLDTRPSTPIEVPELFARIANYLDRHTLVQMIQVCRKFHQVCIPLLWHTVYLQEPDEDDDEDVPDCPWEGDKGFRMGFLRHGRWIEHLHLIGLMIQDGDLELIAENCTRLKSLDLTGTNVTAETLQVLIHSDPYKTDPESTKKRKHGEDAGEDGDNEESEDDIDDDLNSRMAKYRRKSITETETEQEPDSQYESVGLDPSSSDQGGDDENATGPIARPSHGSSSSSSSRAYDRIPVHRLSGTTRAAKFKGTPTRFPFQLEVFVLNKCRQLTGNKALKVLQRLGPQLQRLSLDHVVDLDDSSLIEIMPHCPNLKFLSLRGCDVTDRFLVQLAENTTKNAGKGAIEELKLDMAQVTGTGLVTLAKGCKSHLTALSSRDNLGMTDEVLYAFIQESAIHTRESASKLKLRTCINNSVLTKINLSQSADITETALRTLFRHATELQEILLDGTKVQDGSLIVLAENYVRRLKRLGLGVPTSWAQHEQAMASTSPSSSSSSLSKDALVRDISATFVPGGLQLLSLSGCDHITNRGLRALGRACVGLHSLSITNCAKLSLELFAGPWTSYALRVLHMQDMALMADDASEAKEEENERARFPLQLEPLPPQDGPLAKPADPIAWPVTKTHVQLQFEAFGFGAPGSGSSSSRRKKTQKKKPNSSDQRAVLRAFYGVLGRCRNLEDLDMCNMGFRIRVRDGLDLVLPALQQNLTEWHLTCHWPQMVLPDAELAWFGKHFGSGLDFYQQGGDQGQGTQVSKLKMLSVSDLALEGGDADVYEWFMEQLPGFNMEYHN